MDDESCLAFTLNDKGELNISAAWESDAVAARFGMFLKDLMNGDLNENILRAVHDFASQSGLKLGQIVQRVNIETPMVSPSQVFSRLAGASQ